MADSGTTPLPAASGAVARLADRRPGAVRRPERGRAGDGALSGATYAGAVGCDGPGADPAAVRGRGYGLWAVELPGMRRSSASSGSRRLPSRRRLLPAWRSVGAWRSTRGGADTRPRRPGGRSPSASRGRPRRDRVVHVPGESLLGRGDGAARDALRRRVRAPERPARPPAAGPRSVPTRPSRSGRVTSWTRAISA